MMIQGHIVNFKVNNNNKKIILINIKTNCISLVILGHLQDQSSFLVVQDAWRPYISVY